MKSRVYLLLYRHVLPHLPYSRISLYIRWKLALVLIGAEFHFYKIKQRTDQIEMLCDPTRLFNQELSKLLEGKNNPRVLDVGAGPVSKVGWLNSDGGLSLVAVDPLAEQYNKLLIDANCSPPVWTEKGYGENLGRDYSHNSFDIIHARNCIDHCLNPLVVIFEALKVLKPGHFFYMNHYRNEGLKASYYGLHQWNFDVVDGYFIISDFYGNVINVGEVISDVAVVANITLVDDRIIVILKKHNYASIVI